MYGSAPQRSAGPRLPKKNPQAIGRLGVSALQVKATPGALGCRGTGVTRRSSIEVSVTPPQPATALWYNAIARWYAAVLPGRPALARHPILASKLPLSEDGQGAWETIVTELSSKQAREKCHQTLVAGLRLIRPEERVTAIAAAMQEVEAREKRLYAAVVRQ